MKRPDGVTVLSIYHFVVGAALVLCICSVLALLMAVFLDRSPNIAVPAILLALIAVGLFICLAAHIATGWGLLKMQEWGRWLAIALAVLSLPGFPVGTAVGGLSLWYLLQPEVKDVFLGTSVFEDE